jgi:hypothetical protein
MAVTQGIAKINGVAIGNVAKTGGVTKANIWSLSGEQRQASLFRTLQNSGFATYTPGKNSASFSATGSGTSTAQVFFQYDNHVAGNQYNFQFNLNATIAGSKIWACSLSADSSFTTDVVATGFTTNTTGAKTATSIAYNVTNSTIYIGIKLTVSSNTSTCDISDLIVSEV